MVKYISKRFPVLCGNESILNLVLNSNDKAEEVKSLDLLGWSKSWIETAGLNEVKPVWDKN